MPYSLLEIFGKLPTFASVLFRVTGLLLTAPVISSSVLPIRIRAALALMLALVAFPLAQGGSSFHGSLTVAIGGAVGELVIGSAIGLALMFLILGADFAGHVISQQAGIQLAEVFNPQLETESSAVGQIYGIVFTLLFLIVGGHRASIVALLDTFRVIPIGRVQSTQSVLVLLTDTLEVSLTLAIRLSGPVLIALLLTETTLGFVARTVPQLHLLSVGFPLRILVALAVAGSALYAARDVLLDALNEVMSMIRATLGTADLAGSGVP